MMAAIFERGDEDELAMFAGQKDRKTDCTEFPEKALPTEDAGPA
jgi:hypothetical protein